MFTDLNQQQMQDAAGMNELRKAKRSEWPDRLSGWAFPPPNARAVGEVEPVRVFESAEAAMAFLRLTVLAPVIPPNPLGTRPV